MSSIDTPALDSNETKLCLSSRGVQASASKPGRRGHNPERPAHVRRVERRSELGGETRSRSDHRSPATIRASSCHRR